MGSSKMKVALVTPFYQQKTDRQTDKIVKNVILVHVPYIYTHMVNSCYFNIIDMHCNFIYFYKFVSQSQASLQLLLLSFSLYFRVLKMIFLVYSLNLVLFLNVLLHTLI